MSAGASAAQQARRLDALATDHERAAAQARNEGQRYAAAAVAERQLARKLAPLAANGYHLLPDRKWPGSRSAQLDLVMVGPSGVWIIDSKHWNEFSISGDRMFRGQDDVTEEILRLADVADDAASAFAEVGLAPGEVRALVVMAGRTGHLGEVGPVEIVGDDGVHLHLASRGNRLTGHEVDELLGVAVRHFPAYVGPQHPPQAIIPEPVLAPEPVDFEDGALLTEDEVLEAAHEAELAAPVEDWMTYLHPTQAKLVRRSFNGPSRIRGSAGTGKTVVGLHRAAYLARAHRTKKVLFTTYVRTLPAVMSNLLHRLEPTVADRVEFVNVHRFARRVLKDRGIPVKQFSGGQEWRIAWATLPKEEKERLSDRSGTRSDEYWREEVQNVIKGRGITAFDEYAACARPGRVIRLNGDDRRAVWSLYQRYQLALHNANVIDHHDLINLAEKSLREQPLDDYAAVIVDEAQDLSLSMVRMLHSLVGDAPDAFTLIGDGQQSIYPGGYTLSEAHISLAGRGVVLDINYRNTVQIHSFATAMIAESTFTDIDDEAGTTPQPPDPSETSRILRRHGPAPAVETFVTAADHDRALVSRVRDASRMVGVNLGDIAVLCDTTKQVDRVAAALAAVSIPTLELTKYVGTPTDAVKIGTIKRAKGLEFKAVLLPWTPTSSRATQEERAARELRERYVAATRARDLLWIGRIAPQPSR